MNDDKKITYFGESLFRGERRRFGIKKADRQKHFYVIGKTGMGKTTLLENMAMQDIRNGEGVAFIDPHGDTAYKLLDFVPKERIDDVIYFDPADTTYPIGLNVMESVDPEQRHFIASGLMGVFKKIFGPEVWSARMEYILSNTVLALLEYPHSTLLSINPMLSVKEFRKKVVDHVNDPVVKAFWTHEFAKYTERFAAEATPAIQNKVGQFTSNPLLRNIVGQLKSAFDIRRIMDERKILIINLAKGRVGEENGRLLGAMLVTKIYLAAMSRVNIIDESKRADFYLYVDEFQTYATESFQNILSEARKYHLCLTLANQYMAQLDETVRDAVIGNVGTMVTFRVGADDAETLEKEFSPEFTVQDLVNIGFADVYLKLMIDGVASRPFSAHTLPPISIEEESHRKEIMEASRKNFSIHREQVEKRISEWLLEVTSAEDSKKEVARKEMSGTRPQQSERQAVLYDAVCSVCGKKTQVPFHPDPQRPVFCKDHLGFAAGLPPRSAEKKETGRQSQEISLKVLENRRRFDQRENKPSLQPVPKREGGIQALREALKKSLEKAKSHSESPPEKNGEQKEENAESNGVLKPGESIKL